MHYVVTKTEVAHLVPDMYVDGMHGDVPRTLCSSMIKSCSEPVHLEVNSRARFVPNLCSVCERTYGDGQIFDLAEKMYNEDK